MTTMADLHDRGDGYFLRFIEERGGERHFEVLRADGHSFGSAPEGYVDSVVAADQSKAAPATGYTLEAVVERPAPTEPVEDDGSNAFEPVEEVRADGDGLGAIGSPESLAEVLEREADEK